MKDEKTMMSHATHISWENREDICEEKLKRLLLHVSELEKNFRQNYLSLDTGQSVTKKKKNYFHSRT